LPLGAGFAMTVFAIRGFGSHKLFLRPAARSARQSKAGAGLAPTHNGSLM